MRFCIALYALKPLISLNKLSEFYFSLKIADLSFSLKIISRNHQIKSKLNSMLTVGKTNCGIRVLKNQILQRDCNYGTSWTQESCTLLESDTLCLKLWTLSAISHFETALAKRVAESHCDTPLHDSRRTEVALEAKGVLNTLDAVFFSLLGVQHTTQKRRA